MITRSSGSSAPRPRPAGEQVEHVAEQADARLARLARGAGARGRLAAEGRLDDLVDQRRAVGGLVLEHADRAGLLLEQRGDEVVERVLGDEVGDEGRLQLADAVDAVLGLPVVAGHPVEVVEHDVGAGGEGDADAGGVQVAEEDAHARRRSGRRPPPSARCFWVVDP